jgi:hypothetical protein
MLAHAGQKAPALRNEKLDPRYTPKADYNSGYTPGNSNYDSNYYQVRYSHLLPPPMPFYSMILKGQILSPTGNPSCWHFLV